MKILTQLTAHAADGIWEEPVGIRSQAVIEHPTRKGRFLNVSAGAAGILIRTAHGQVGIPMDEIIRLATQADPLATGTLDK